MLTELEEVLQKCTQLRVLDVTVNHLTEIKNLHKCSMLVELRASNNRIHKIGMGLSGLANLKVLDLSMNKIKVMEGLSTLISLEKLVLYGNEIVEV
jgi:Leucine-rich repeat (LRR) protein